jgi:hypothetical protein
VIHLLNRAEDVTAAFSTKDHAYNGVDNDPRFNTLVNVAFDKSWRFVEKDPFLAHNPKAMLRDRLRTHLEISMRNGEQDLLSLANTAIGKLRAEFGTPSGS